MKKFRKLIPALCMLLVSALFVGTSTYAWFSMNTSVSATNMKVTAKSDSIYLLISKEKTTADGIQGDKLTTVAIKNEDTALLPSARTISATKEGVKNAELTANATSLAVPGNWYTAYANEEDKSAVDGDTEKVLSAFNGYVQEYTYNFTLAKGSNDAKDLTVSECKLAAATGEGKTIAPVRVIVACGNKVVEFNSTGTTVSAGDMGATTATDKVLADSVTDSSVQTVKVYVYYNGNDTAVYTNNIANLAGTSIDLTFTVSAAAETGN